MSCDKCRKYGGGRLPWLVNAYEDLTNLPAKPKHVVEPRWGPCPHCTKYKWAVLMPDDELMHTDNEVEARELCFSRGGLLVRDAA